MLLNAYSTRDKLTRDVGGKNGTSEFADAVIEEMENSNTTNVSDEPTHVS